MGDLHPPPHWHHLCVRSILNDGGISPHDAIVPSRGQLPQVKLQNWLCNGWSRKMDILRIYPRYLSVCTGVQQSWNSHTRLINAKHFALWRVLPFDLRILFSEIFIFKSHDSSWEKFTNSCILLNMCEDPRILGLFRKKLWLRTLLCGFRRKECLAV